MSQASLFSMPAVTPPKGLLEPQENAYWELCSHLQNGRNVVLQQPTGSGKTQVAKSIFEWCEASGLSACFYVNRKILIEQTSNRFEAGGLDHGVRAANYEDKFYPDRAIQICSADTERARVYSDDPRWPAHHSDIVIVDEAHIQKGETMQTILDDHISRGAKVMLMSATPIGLSKMVPNLHLVSGGTLAQYRECGLLSLAITKGIQQPDLRKVKRGSTGEFVLDDKTRQQYVQHIVGSVINNWKKFNPDAKPALLYAPGKAESVWLTQQFYNNGIPWAHIDATDAWIDGKAHKLERSLWEDIQGKLLDGTIKGLSSRFKLREGVDLPAVEHLIMATPIGSLGSYLQVCGRGMRSSPGKDKCTIQDHGGNFWRHGSPNNERPWEVLWQMTQAQASKFHEYRIKHKETTEPIRCPNCLTERTHGRTCMFCGYESPKGTRHIIMEDGTLKECEERLHPVARTQNRHDTQAQWNRMYFGFKNKKLDKTWVQMEAFFAKEHGYWPPRTLLNQPKNNMDWHRYVYSVEVRDQVTNGG
mgnify:CR=1 FL=1